MNEDDAAKGYACDLLTAHGTLMKHECIDEMNQH